MGLTELEKLRRKCILVNQFMAEHGGFPPAVRPFFAESNRRIDEAYSLGNIRLLRAMSSDIDWQVINHMPISMVLKLEQLSKTKLGYRLDTIEIMRKETINRILKNKRIQNGEEYMFLRDYLRNTPVHYHDREDLEKLNALLTEFLIF